MALLTDAPSISVRGAHGSSLESSRAEHFDTSWFKPPTECADGWSEMGMPRHCTCVVCFLCCLHVVLSFTWTLTCRNTLSELNEVFTGV